MTTTHTHSLNAIVGYQVFGSQRYSDRKGTLRGEFNRSQYAKACGLAHELYATNDENFTACIVRVYECGCTSRDF